MSDTHSIFKSYSVADNCLDSEEVKAVANHFNKCLEIMKDRQDKLQEENDKLKKEVEDWKEIAMKKNIHPYTGEIIQPKDILNLQKEVYELQDKLKDIEQATEYTAYHELAIQELVDEIKSLKHTNKLLRDDFCRTEKKLEKENKELQDKVDSMESEVLDAQDSYALQKQTDQVYYHGEPLKCIEDGEPITISDVFPNKFIKENESLKKSNKQKTILIRKFRRQIKGLDKVMLSASFQSWREVQVATNPQYTIQDEIDFLNGETTNQELIKEVFEDLYPIEYEYDAENKTYTDTHLATTSDEDSD